MRRRPDATGTSPEWTLPTPDEVRTRTDDQRATGWRGNPIIVTPGEKSRVAETGTNHHSRRSEEG
jgi:hypothetical protein